jgi:hypothetical protein
MSRPAAKNRAIVSVVAALILAFATSKAAFVFVMAIIVNSPIKVLPVKKIDHCWDADDDDKMTL